MRERIFIIVLEFDIYFVMESPSFVCLNCEKEVQWVLIENINCILWTNLQFLFDNVYIIKKLIGFVFSKKCYTKNN